MKILIVEDERELRKNMTAYLSAGDYICETAGTYREAQQKIMTFPYDVVLLDLMLPDGQGLELLKLLKDKSPETGILIASAKNSVQDRIKGLNLGADDFLSKPFHLPELQARIQAIYRRRKMQGKTFIHFEEIRMQPETHEVWVHDELVELTLKEYELLQFFITNQRKVLSRQTIAEYLWGDHIEMMDSLDFIYQHVKNLRKKILAAGGQDYIQTVYGMGYKFTQT